jgi:phosphate/sulfate permease
METPDGSDEQKQILKSLGSIVDISERIVHRLRVRQSRLWIVSSFLVGMLVFGVLLSIAIGLLVPSYDPSDIRAYFDTHSSSATLFALLVLSGLSSWLVAYLLLRRRKNPELEELSALIAKMKEKDENKGTTESALSLTEKILALLPKVVRKRNLDSFLFGITAFILASLVARPALGILVGAIVWLYFRYEMNRTYEREIAALQEQERIFEQRKKEFLESL